MQRFNLLFVLAFVLLLICPGCDCLPKRKKKEANVDDGSGVDESAATEKMSVDKMECPDKPCPACPKCTEGEGALRRGCS